MPGTTPTPANYSALVDEVVTQQFMRGSWNNTKRIRTYFKKLDEAKAIQFDGSGKYIEWKVRLGEWQAGYRGDLVQRQFSRKQHRATYTAPYSFIEVPGTVSERDLQFLNSPEALDQFQKTFLTDMGTDFVKQINKKMLTENAGSNTALGYSVVSTNDVPVYGLPTVFQYGSAAQQYDPDANTTSGAIGAGDKECLPNGTYCGISTNPVTGVTGVDNQVTGSAAPVLVNWSSTAWNGSTTWSANCQDVLDHMITRLTRSTDPSDAPDLCIMNRTNFLGTKAKLRSAFNQQVVLVDSSGRSPNIGQYGEMMIPYNGVDITWDSDHTTGAVFMLNSKQVKYRIFPQTALANIEGGAVKGEIGEYFRVAQMPDIDQGGWKVVAVNCAQQIHNVYYQGAAYNFA
jgi:hypothetical protein